MAAQTGTEVGTGSAQKRGRKTEQQRTAELGESLPKGISVGFYSDGRSKPYFVRFGPDRTVKSFELEQDRNDAAEDIAAKRDQGGADVLNFKVDELREWKEFRARCPAPLHELEALWNGAPKKDVMLVKDAVPKYLKLRTTEDISDKSDTYRHMDLHLERLVAAYGDLRLDQVTPELIRELLDGLKDRKGKGPASKSTRRDHRVHWFTFFKRAVDEEWCDRNPCVKVKAPKAQKVEKIPLTPMEVFDLLKYNRTETVIGRIALELFGGLRAASAARLKKDHLRFGAKGIRMPGAVKDEEGDVVNNHKSGTTKYRQGHPDVLWAWLEHAPEECWNDITEANYSKAKGYAFVRARVKNPGNVFRDTFCSCHLAALKNPPLTSYLAQHKHMSQTETYEGAMEEADAKLILAMTPAAVRQSFTEFSASIQTP